MKMTTTETSTLGLRPYIPSPWSVLYEFSRHDSRGLRGNIRPKSRVQKGQPGEMDGDAFEVKFILAHRGNGTEVLTRIAEQQI